MWRAWFKVVVLTLALAAQSATPTAHRALLLSGHWISAQCARDGAPDKRAPASDYHRAHNCGSCVLPLDTAAVLGSGPEMRFVPARMGLARPAVVREALSDLRRPRANSARAPPAFLS